MQTILVEDISVMHGDKNNSYRSACWSLPGHINNHEGAIGTDLLTLPTVSVTVGVGSGGEERRPVDQFTGEVHSALQPSHRFQSISHDVCVIGNIKSIHRSRRLLR